MSKILIIRHNLSKKHQKTIVKLWGKLMKFTFFKKSRLFLVICLAVILCFSVTLNKTDSASVYFNGTTRKLPIYSVDRNDNKIAISFDCAYGADYTKSLLDTLDYYK